MNYSVPGAWDKDKSIAAVKSVMRKNNILATRMPYETRGALYDLQLMPAGKGQLPAKSGKPIEKYGGYNKVKGSLFLRCGAYRKEGAGKVDSAGLYL